MNNLRQLIGTNVNAELEDGVIVKCKVLDLNVNTYYFEEKQEPIYITFSLSPLDDFNGDYEQFSEVHLENIRKC